MKVGNVTHAVILSAVGIGAVGALFVQIKNRMNRPVATQTAARVATQDAPPTVLAGLPRVVYGDPFTHPRLPRAHPVTKQADSPPPPDKKNSHKGFPNEFQLPGPSDHAPFNPKVPTDVEATGKEAPPAPKGPKLLLQAVVSATDPVAFISIDDKDPRDFRVGDTVTPGVTIKRIIDGAVELRTSGAAKTLRVGERLQL